MNNLILKAVSYKAFTNIRVVAIIYKKIILAICFYTSYRFKDIFKPL
jgi:hypothetical protein